MQLEEIRRIVNWVEENQPRKVKNIYPCSSFSGQHSIDKKCIIEYYERGYGVIWVDTLIRWSDKTEDVSLKQIEDWGWILNGMEKIEICSPIPSQKKTRWELILQELQ